MDPLKKHTWLIETIHRAGKITFAELADRWERNKELSDYQELNRTTFNRWREKIAEQFGINIECQRRGGYLYYIENPEALEKDNIRKLMLDSYAVGNLIGDNLAIKDRIIVDQIPSGREKLADIMAAMREARVIRIAYQPFGKPEFGPFPVEPYCVKLFENRWYLLACSIDDNRMRIYGIGRIQKIEPTDQTFKLPKDFSAEEYFHNYYGIVANSDYEPERIVIRANESHKYYLDSLPLHHSQRMIEDCGAYADFELYVAPTYDFIMKLLHFGTFVEVISPASFRQEVKGWIDEMATMYKND